MDSVRAVCDCKNRDERNPVLALRDGPLDFAKHWGVLTCEKSVIGNDLKITGQGLKIIGRGLLQVDGEIEGDVQAVEVIIGEQGKVTGMVSGQQVMVRGKVSGVALFEGRSRRAADEAALSSVIEGRSSYTSGTAPGG